MLVSTRNLFSLAALPLLLLFVTDLSAQDAEGVIFLNNPSFEDMPRHSFPPKGWRNCGPRDETPPDIHPDPEFLFKVGMKAQDQNTFVGMVTRDTETYESLGQELTTPFVGGQCYRFDIHLARSRSYLSMSKITRQPTNYIEPVQLRIWGGYSYCDRSQLLGTSELVTNWDWGQYNIKPSPEQDFTHLILEAYYPPASLLPSNGNILLDNARPLMPIPCDDEAALVAEPALANAPEIRNPVEDIRTTPVPPPTPKGERPRSTTRPRPAVVSVPEPEAPKVRLGETEAVLRQGAVFAVEEITFRANSAELEDDSEGALQELVSFMQQNNNVIVEIGGHASQMAGDQFAADLSADRARMVVEYLRDYNIGFDRLLHRGYGKTKPKCTESTKDCNRRNQRVEVTILKIRNT